MRKGIIFALLFTAPVMVQAGVYTCEVDGKKVYQSTPCKPGDLPVKIYAPEPSGPPTPNSTRSTVLEDAAERKRLWQLAQNKKVAVGMPPDFVRRAWGNPTDINRTIRGSGVREQWVYRWGPGITQYVYISDGKVTSISE